MLLFINFTTRIMKGGSVPQECARLPSCVCVSFFSTRHYTSPPVVMRAVINLVKWKLS